MVIVFSCRIPVGSLILGEFGVLCVCYLVTGAGHCPWAGCTVLGVPVVIWMVLTTGLSLQRTIQMRSLIAIPRNFFWGLAHEPTHIDLHSSDCNHSHVPISSCTHNTRDCSKNQLCYDVQHQRYPEVNYLGYYWTYQVSIQLPQVRKSIWGTLLIWLSWR